MGLGNVIFLIPEIFFDPIKIFSDICRKFIQVLNVGVIVVLDSLVHLVQCFLILMDLLLNSSA